MSKSEFFSIRFENNFLIFLDQTKLPFEKVYHSSDDFNRISEAIKRLEIRGAPAIGVAAAFALALSQKNKVDPKKFIEAYETLLNSRPTAVNLKWGIDRLKNIFEKNLGDENLFLLLVDEAISIHEEDKIFCNQIAANGLKLFTKKINLLTHCNAGALATGGSGTALNIIRAAFEAGFINHVYADETRPLLQGSRLTAFELEQYQIPFSILTDSTAAFLMQQNKIDMIIAGADRIARNGDSANKIGTYNLAVLANHHSIPFYIAAPSSTIDASISSGKEIPIEFRSGAEILSINNTEVSKRYYPTIAPAFDVTPAELIAGIITEIEIARYPFNFAK